MVYGRLIDFLFPELCPRCRGVTRAGFCAGCRADFEPLVDPCSKCGLTRPVADCPRGRGDWHVDYVVAPFVYAGPLVRQIQDLKFGGARSLGRAFGLLLATTVRSDPQLDALVPVPLHPRRLRQRGYNQADEIARPLAGTLKAPICVARIERRAATAAQTSLSPSERRANVAGAFRVGRRFDRCCVAVVDDVITTGATVNSLARSLKDAGATTVAAFAVARTQGRPNPSGSETHQTLKA